MSLISGRHDGQGCKKKTGTAVDKGMKRKNQSPIELIEISSDDEDRTDSHRTGLSKKQRIETTYSNSIWDPGDLAPLTQVYALFPDICHRYAERVFADFRHLPAPEAAEALIDEIIRVGEYPKEERAPGRAETPGTPCARKAWGPGDGVNRGQTYKFIARMALESDFPNVPSNYIGQVLTTQGSLFAAHQTLDKQERSYDKGRRMPYVRKKDKPYQPLTYVPVESLREVVRNNADIVTELTDAREQRSKEHERRQNKQEATRNSTTLRDDGGVAECQCCYADFTLNELIVCQGDDAHFFCSGCVRKSAETQVGMMKHDLKCFSTDGCAAKFERLQLAEALGETLMSKLADLQQQDELANADIPGLQGCPFCDFQAVLPPIEEDKLFACQNPKCQKVSCRLCGKESHIPKTCDEAPADKHMRTRHKIEEAMSEALIRTCPKCKVKIIKEEGCNKMLCTKCRTVMCYTCQKDITEEGYEHFDQSYNCFVQDRELTVDQTHFNEVSRARQRAIDEALKKDPKLKADDIEVSAPGEVGDRANPRMGHMPPPQIRQIDHYFRAGIDLNGMPVHGFGNQPGGIMPPHANVLQPAPVDLQRHDLLRYMPRRHVHHQMQLNGGPVLVPNYGPIVLDRNGNQINDPDGVQNFQHRPVEPPLPVHPNNLNPAGPNLNNAYPGQPGAAGPPQYRGYGAYGAYGPPGGYGDPWMRRYPDYRGQ